ncbi:MAG: hypothetical protein MZU97_10970 [Bacillus subtilis]|nr:hypothetical protein [Bacillus subtilis]
MIKLGKALIEATEQLEREKNIPKDIVIKSLCDAMVTAYKKHIKSPDVINIVSYVNESTSEIGVFRKKTVVETVEDFLSEITLEDAKKIDKKAEIGGEVLIDVTPEDFGRIAAQCSQTGYCSKN